MTVDFTGFHVVSFESRRASEMANLIERCGGKPISAPSMREAPLERNSDALSFADRLFDGQVDAVILLTGVGTRMLAQAVATRHETGRFIEALGAVATIARGPKPVAALREMGLKPTMTVPEPNTWRDLLAAMDEHCPVDNKNVAVQEYGQSNTQLLNGLRQRGADVLPVPVYKWQLPEDLAPMRQAIEQIIAGNVEFVVFTSATQVRHVFQVAQRDGCDTKLRNAFAAVCIGSIGPICTEAVREADMTVDFEPDSPHMTQLVRGLARNGHNLLDKKRIATSIGVNTNDWRRIDMSWPAANEHPPPRTIADSVFMKAARREPVPYTPIWLMRQAGRYQRAYRAIRTGVSLLELCKTPELAAEVTLMAVDQLGVDAAIIFADILLIAEPLGLGLEFVKGEGPRIDRPVRCREDVNRMRRAKVDELGYVYDAIRLTRRALRPDIALIGFAGGPFTIASYLIEGGKSSNYARTKSMMFSDQRAWDALMKTLVQLISGYLNAQIEAGADAVQIFDSWAGSLGPDDYRRYVLPHMKTLISEVNSEAPLIHFTTGNPAILPLMKQGGGDVIGLDWRADLAAAWQLLGPDVAVMGNLDPTVLFCSPTEIRKHASIILDKAAGRPGHIFNLGHGIMPTMSPEHVIELVDAVHELSTR